MVSLHLFSTEKEVAGCHPPPYPPTGWEGRLGGVALAGEGGGATGEGLLGGRSGEKGEWGGGGLSRVTPAGSQ